MLRALLIAWMLVGAPLSMLVVPAGLAFAQAPTISDIQVSGTQRIDPETVRSYMLVQPGDRFDSVLLDRSLKALFGTGLFADVTLRREGASLVVNVVENPVINRISFEGNQRLKNADLEAEIQLRPRLVFTRTRVQQDVQRILDIYRLSGRFAARVEPKVVQLEQNRVDLVFEIDEGPLTRIRAISFIGNKVFSDSKLRGEIQTEEYAFYKLLTTTDTYDPDRLSFDRELLRRFYLKEGYADFRVVSAVAELTPDREAFVVTFTVEEGERYTFGDINFDIQLRRLEAQDLAPLVEFETGDDYDAGDVEDTVDLITDQLGTLGYAFVDVRPVPNQNREARTIGITFAVSEGPRVFVERINVTGNVRTLDRVVRREFELVEGDAFNTSKLRRSRRRIRNLGFFGGVSVNNVEGSSPDRTIINVEVQEQSTGEISFGVGFSTIDQFVGDIGIRERNLLGRGQDLSVRFSGSLRNTQFDVSFTEPYFLERDLSFGIDLFRTTKDRQNDSSFSERRIGGGIRFGYDLAPDLRQVVGYNARQTEITDVQSDASRFIADQEGETTVSQITQRLTYDIRDSRNNPTEGYLLGLETDFAGLGGDLTFVRGVVRGSYHTPVPFGEDLVLSLIAEGGAIQGIGEDVPISERFFLGGANLRGFERAGVGPRDTETGDALGGNRYYVGTIELGFPLGLPDDLGLRGFVFTDAGSLWEIDETGANLFDSSAIRASSGVGLAWSTAFGLIRVDLAQALLKEEFDETEIFRFSFGTRF